MRKTITFLQIKEVTSKVQEFRVTLLGQADSPKRPRPEEIQIVHGDHEVRANISDINGMSVGMVNKFIIARQS